MSTCVMDQCAWGDVALGGVGDELEMDDSGSPRASPLLDCGDDGDLPTHNFAFMPLNDLEGGSDKWESGLVREASDSLLDHKFDHTHLSPSTLSHHHPPHHHQSNTPSSGVPRHAPSTATPTLPLSHTTGSSANLPKSAAAKTTKGRNGAAASSHPKPALARKRSASAANLNAPLATPHHTLSATATATTTSTTVSDASSAFHAASLSSRLSSRPSHPSAAATSTNPVLAKRMQEMAAHPDTKSCMMCHAPVAFTVPELCTHMHQCYAKRCKARSPKRAKLAPAPADQSAATMKSLRNQVLAMDDTRRQLLRLSLEKLANAGKPSLKRGWLLDNRDLPAIWLLFTPCPTTHQATTAKAAKAVKAAKAAKAPAVKPAGKGRGRGRAPKTAPVQPESHATQPVMMLPQFMSGDYGFVAMPPQQKGFGDAMMAHRQGNFGVPASLRCDVPTDVVGATGNAASTSAGADGDFKNGFNLMMQNCQTPPFIPSPFSVPPASQMRCSRSLNMQSKVANLPFSPEPPTKMAIKTESPGDNAVFIA